MPGLAARSVFWRVQFILLNLWFWTLAPIVTFVYFHVATALLWLHLMILRDRRKNDYLIRRSISCYGATIVRLGWPFIRIKYVDLAPSEKPPFVLVSNHTSSSDGYLMAYLPLEAVQALNIWPAHTPIIGFIARNAGYLRIREIPFEEFLASGSKLLKDGCSVIAFPEGTRSGNRGMGPFHGSAFRLAMQNQAPIVPIVLAGNSDKPLRGSAWLNPGPVVMTKLPAVMPEKYNAMTPFALKNFVREMIQQYLAEHPV